MAAPDFYFAINATFRYIHGVYGKDALIDYWRRLGHEYDKRRIDHWRRGGLKAIGDDWRDYFAEEPQAVVDVAVTEDAVELDVKVCPAIKHLRDHHRNVFAYFCEHCDHVCGAMAEQAGYAFYREGGNGSCRQRFVCLTNDEMDGGGC
jgi:hypothetical protein